ncbi:hypothetical protein BN1708_001519 [Verticillium longisporum]|uniref:Uncharacterized protein n=1 Tax=Verticillium longisporum TaxID=100787 RepID=A0A0G4MYK1_VERLO|nr:hypothetical protein BN1708_001519 [Verticillium longisporum]
MLILSLFAILAHVLPVWAKCSADALNRVFERADAWPYCASLLGPKDPRTTVLPPRAAATYAPDRLISACSCLLSLSISSSGQVASHSAGATRSYEPVVSSTTSACGLESTHISKLHNSTQSHIHTKSRTTKSRTTTTRSSSSSTSKYSGPKSTSKSSKTRSTTSPSLTSTTATQTRNTYAARPRTFTGVSVTGDLDATGCYAVPTPTGSLRESRLNNTDRNPPYVEAIYFDQNATQAKNSLAIDNKGIHFASSTCKVKVDVMIDNFFGQLNNITNTTCLDAVPSPGNTTSIDRNDARDLRDDVKPRMMALESFFVLLKMKDQCGEPLRPELRPTVRIGPLPCETLQGPPGTFVATCPFPSSSSTEMRCEASVDALLSRLARGRLPGACPRLTTIWALLLDQMGPRLTQASLFQPFLEPGLNLGPRTLTTIAALLNQFRALWEPAGDFFASTTRGQSALEDTIASHGGAQALRRQACRALHQAPTPFNLTLAGTSAVVLATLKVAPNSTLEYTRNMTDSEQLACCPNVGTCTGGGADGSYGREALVPGSNCICGRTVDGSGVAFRTGLCKGYDACDADRPCGEGMACLVDSCCETNICVNGTECNAPGLARRMFGGKDRDARGGA